MNAGPAPEPPSVPLSALDALPHRPPFLFVTRVGQASQGRAVALWTVSGQEDFFRGHFPGHPVVPGVLLGEALAQVAGIALSTSPEVRVPRGAPGMIAQLELRFHAPLWPPAQVLLRAERVGGMATLHRFEVAAMRLESEPSAWTGEWPESEAADPMARRRAAAQRGELVSGAIVLSVPGSVDRET